jgi:hypothetical protein
MFGRKKEKKQNEPDFLDDAFSWKVVFASCGFAFALGFIFRLEDGETTFLIFLFMGLYAAWIIRQKATELVQAIQEQRRKLQEAHDEIAQRFILFQQAGAAEKRIDELKREIGLALQQEEFLTAQLAARAGG